MKYLRFKLKVLWYGIRVKFSLKKKLKPTGKFLLSYFMKQLFYKTGPGVDHATL